jgi:hypothetical protein
MIAKDIQYKSILYTYQYCDEHFEIKGEKMCKEQKQAIKYINIHIQWM